MLLNHTCVHNNIHSSSDIMAEAEKYCLKQGLRLTDQRRHILRLLAESAKPLGAYDLLEQTQTASKKRQAPVSVYRALDFLLDAGLIHRLVSRNAFVICPHPHATEEAIVFLICENCARVDEATSQSVCTSLADLSLERNFSLKSKIIELTGLCKTCAEQSMPVTGG